jgi:hypothetical protein
MWTSSTLRVTGSMFLWNFGIYLRFHTALQPGRWQSTRRNMIWCVNSVNRSKRHGEQRRRLQTGSVCECEPFVIEHRMVYKWTCKWLQSYCGEIGRMVTFVINLYCTKVWTQDVYQDSNLGQFLWGGSSYLSSCDPPEQTILVGFWRPSSIVLSFRGTETALNGNRT